MEIAAGRKAPDFTLPDQDGNKKKLKDFHGKWLVLYFYPKDNTPGCTIEAKEFSALIGEFEKVGAAVVGVSPDAPERHCAFIEKQELKITLLSDTEKKTLQKYGVWRRKMLYGRDFMGVVRTTCLIGPDGLLNRTWNNVKARGHAEEVLEALKALTSR